MAEKELKKLKRRELLQMLLIQCEESERLQQELDETNKQFGAMSESYERLKTRLNVKDERLNQKDARIKELNLEIEKLKGELEELERTKGLKKAGFGQTATDPVSVIFENARQALEEYLEGLKKAESGRRVKEEARKPENMEKKQTVLDLGKIASIRKKQNVARAGQPFLVNLRQAGAPERQAEETETELVSLDPAAGEFYG